MDPVSPVGEAARDKSRYDAVMRWHPSIVTLLVGVLQIRPALKIEAIFLGPVPQNSLEELQVMYSPCTTKFGDRIVVRASVGSDSVALANSYDILEDEAEGHGYRYQ